MFFIEQRFFKNKENKIIAYPSLVLDLGNDISDGCFQLDIPIPKDKRKSFNAYAKTLDFLVGEVENETDRKRIYIE